MSNMNDYLPAWHLIPFEWGSRSFLVGGGKGLTLNEEYDVGPPYAGRNSYYSPILIPNSDSGGLNKLRKSCPRRIHTHEARSTAKRQRGPGEKRSWEKGTKMRLRARSLESSGAHKL
jgi:hypothetical protein